MSLRFHYVMSIQQDLAYMLAYMAANDGSRLANIFGSSLASSLGSIEAKLAMDFGAIPRLAMAFGSIPRLAMAFGSIPRLAIILGSMEAKLAMALGSIPKLAIIL